MIITISSAQGQGKTTLLSALEKEGYSVVRNTTARTILKEWGTTLNEVYKCPEKTEEFQESIILAQGRYDQQMKEIIKSGISDVIITERSYADIFTYTLLNLGSINDYNDYVNGYYHSCKMLQQNYDHVVFLTGREYTPEDDGVRSVNSEFGDAVDALVAKYVYRFAPSEDRVHMIDTPDLDQRIAEIKEIISVNGAKNG